MFQAIVIDDIAVISSRISAQVNESKHPIAVSGIAGNGEEALSWLECNYTDICITDIRMPLMDGLELIKIIRGKYPWMASLVISSYDDFAYAQKSIQLDAVDYILKPIEQEQLEEALGKAVNKLVQTRTAFADSLLLSHRTQWAALLECWLEYIKLDKGSREKLIVQTADQLAAISGQRYYLMVFLAEKWLNTVSAELNVDPPEMNFKNSGVDIKPLLLHDVKKVFMNDCINVLKDGMTYIQYRINDMKGAYQRKTIDKLRECIQCNFTRSDFSLQEMADYVSMSKSYMSNIFKQETGETIWNYIIDLRMKKAKELLSKPETKNFEVAADIGYTDYIHFSRLFKEYNGISAQEYRKKSGGQ